MSEDKESEITPKRFEFGVSEGIIIALIGAFAVVFATVYPDYKENRERNKAEVSNFAEKTVFNSHERDFNLLHVSNVSVVGHGNAEWSLEESASIGDHISINVYYHNNGPEIAYDTRVKINYTSCANLQPCWKICARLWAKNSTEELSDCIKVKVSEKSQLDFIDGGTLVFSNNTKWRTAQATWGEHLLPNNQTGTELISGGGLLLGDVGAGWKHQGNINASFAVVKSPGSGNKTIIRGQQIKNPPPLGNKVSNQ